MTVGDLQAQVQMMTGHSGLASKVTGWCNRVLSDICTRAYWTEQLGTGFAHHTVAANATTNSPQTHAFPMNTTCGDATYDEFIAPYAVDQVSLTANTTGPYISNFERPLVRLEIPDLYAQMAGSSAGVISAISKYYAVIRGDINATTGTVSEYFYGVNATTATDGTHAMAITGAWTLAPLDSSNDTCWIMQRYPRVILAGVLARVRLYLGDPVGYLTEKAEYENGIADMLRVEESVTASNPVMGGVDHSALGRIQ